MYFYLFLNFQLFFILFIGCCTQISLPGMIKCYRVVLTVTSQPQRRVSFPTDINECGRDPSLCRGGYCVNSAGSYECQCPDGNELSPDGQSCEGMWQRNRPCQIYFLFQCHYTMYKLRLCIMFIIFDVHIFY